MKDTEFIELLNLYLDHEISAADAVRLEAEVQNNPARRKVYHEYCRMQKACKLLASEFQTETAAAPDKKVVDFTPQVQRTSRRAGVYTFGGFAAAAACVAIIFVGRGRQDATEPAPQAAPQAVAVQVPAPEAVKPTAVAASGSIARPPGGIQRAAAPLVTEQLSLTHNAQAEAMLANSDQQLSDQFKWIPSLQITPIQQRVAADELRFDVRPAPLRPDGRTLGGMRVTPQGKLGDEPTERVILQFTK